MVAHCAQCAGNRWVLSSVLSSRHWAFMLDIYFNHHHLIVVLASSLLGTCCKEVTCNCLINTLVLFPFIPLHTFITIQSLFKVVTDTRGNFVRTQPVTFNVVSVAGSCLISKYNLDFTLTQYQGFKKSQGKSVTLD